MRVLVLGTTGVAGRALAAEFAIAGWDVVGTGRDRTHFPLELRDCGVEFIQSDRYDADQLARVFTRGADMVIDCLCYTAEHARELLGYADSYASAIVLSSKAVYVDDRGRHTNSNDPPRFDGPVREDQAVLAPDYSGAFDSREGYGSNKVAAETTLLESGHQISILRPSRIHGRGAPRPLEWFVVKRLLDGRTAIPVAHGGLTANHPTAAVNLARLARTCAEQPGRRVLNAADPDRPTARDVIQAIAAACGRQVEVVGLDLEASAESGWTPWASWPPFFLDTAAADALGYQPVGSYAQTVAAEVHQLFSLTADQQTRLNLDPYFSRRFDYSVDDRALGRPPGQSKPGAAYLYGSGSSHSVRGRRAG